MLLKEFEDSYSDYDHSEEVGTSDLGARDYGFRRRPVMIGDLPPLDDE